MAHAGYGNHDTQDPKLKNTGVTPAPEAGTQPAAEGTNPAGGRPSAVPPDDRHEDATPGAGTLPSGGQGSEVDPGAG